MSDLFKQIARIAYTGYVPQDKLEEMLADQPTVKQVSFHIDTFWYHVRITGTNGVDQHNNRWFLVGNKLYSEFSYHVINLKDQL